MSHNKYLLVGRVITISHELYPLGESHERSVTAPSYCTPGVVIWCADDGLEEPDAALFVGKVIGRTTIRVNRTEHQAPVVRFLYDGGEYIGLADIPYDYCGYDAKICINIGEDHIPIDFSIRDISSL